MLTDTHCHLDDERYGDNAKAMIEANLPELQFAVTIGTHPKEFKTVLELLEAHEKVYGAIGIHPHYALEITTEAALQAINEVLENDQATGVDKVVGIGECGLDYYWQNQDMQGRTEQEVREAQAELFAKQVELAQKNNLALVVHCRDERDGWDAYVDCLEILRSKGMRHGVIHSFNGDSNIGRQFIDQGFYLGISGLVTFDKTGRLPQAVAELPLEQMVLETDAPYLTPVPHRGKINEPRYTKFVAEKIADLKNMPVDGVLAATEANARKLFGITLE